VEVIVMTGSALLLDALLIVVMMSALSWRESRWSRAAAARRPEVRQRDVRRPREAPRRAKAA
jgi:hypothetical protein